MYISKRTTSIKPIQEPTRKSEGYVSYLSPLSLALYSIDHHDKEVAATSCDMWEDRSEPLRR
jgi:hypothetical protein